MRFPGDPTPACHAIFSTSLLFSAWGLCVHKESRRRRRLLCPAHVLYEQLEGRMTARRGCRGATEGAGGEQPHHHHCPPASDGFILLWPTTRRTACSGLKLAPSRPANARRLPAVADTMCLHSTAAVRLFEPRCSPAAAGPTARSFRPTFAVFPYVTAARGPRLAAMVLDRAQEALRTHEESSFHQMLASYRAHHGFHYFP